MSRTTSTSSITKPPLRKPMSIDESVMNLARFRKYSRGGPERMTLFQKVEDMASRGYYVSAKTGRFRKRRGPKAEANAVPRRETTMTVNVDPTTVSTPRTQTRNNNNNNITTPRPRQAPQTQTRRIPIQ